MTMACRSGWSAGLWYQDYGHGQPLIWLHPGGAGVDARALTRQVTAMADRFRVITPEQRAHGHTPDSAGPLGYSDMADDTAALIDEVVAGPVAVAGYSDGAVVALTLALRRPDLVERLVLVAGVHHHRGWQDGVLDGDPPEFLRESYADVSPDGREHYPVVVDKLAALHADQPSLTAADLGSVSCRTLVMVADDDEVRLEHAVATYRQLPDSELAVVPNTSHGLLVEKPELCNQIITTFLTSSPTSTLAPIRRAGAPTPGKASAAP